MIALKTVQKFTASTIKFVTCIVALSAYLHCADKPQESQSVWQDFPIVDGKKIQDILQFRIIDIHAINKKLYIAGYDETDKSKVVILEYLPLKNNGYETGIKSYTKPSRINGLMRQYSKPYGTKNFGLSHIGKRFLISGFENIIINDLTKSIPVVFEVDMESGTKFKDFPLQQEVTIPFSIIGSSRDEYWICNNGNCSLYNQKNKPLVVAPPAKPTLVGAEPINNFRNPENKYWGIEANFIKKIITNHPTSRRGAISETTFNPIDPEKDPFQRYDKNDFSYMLNAYTLEQLAPYSATKACALGYRNYEHTLLAIELDEKSLKYSIKQLKTPHAIHKIAIANNAEEKPLLYALTQALGSDFPVIKVAAIEMLIRNADKAALLNTLKNEKMRQTIQTLTNSTATPTTTITEKESSPEIPIILVPATLKIKTITPASIAEGSEQDGESEEVAEEETLTHTPVKTFPPIVAKDKKGKKYLLIIDQAKGKDQPEDIDKERRDGITERALELSSSFLSNGLLKNSRARIEHIYKTKNNIYLLIKIENTLYTYKRSLWKKSLGWKLIASKNIPLNAEILGMNVSIHKDSSTKKIVLIEDINIKIGDCILKEPLRTSAGVTEPKNEEQRKALCIAPSQLKNQADVIIKPEKEEEKEEGQSVQKPIVQSKPRGRPIYQGPWKNFSTFIQTNVWQPIKNIFNDFKKSLSNFFDRLRIGSL